MNYTCGNCKYMTYNKEYLYPYKCKLNKKQSFSESEIQMRIELGYKCDKYELKGAK